MIAKKKTQTQSSPPRVGLSKIFKNNIYPPGEEVEYSPSRMSSAEAKEKERLAQGDPTDNYQNIRRAAEVHRQVRSYARQNIKPGMTMTEIAEMIENGTRALVEESGFESGIGFPTGLSCNEVAAHYTPNAGDTKGKPRPDSTDSSAQIDRRHESRLWRPRQRANRRLCIHHEL